MAETPDHPFARSYVAAPPAPRLRAVDGAATVRLTIVLRPHGLPAAIGPALSHEQYVSRHATPADVLERLSRYVSQHGLAVDRADAGQHLVHLSGSYDAGNPCASRRRTWPSMAPRGRAFVARHGHLSLPADLAPDIVAVMGFDQRPVARPYIRIRPLAARAVASYDPAARRPPLPVSDRGDRRRPDHRADRAGRRLPRRANGGLLQGQRDRPHRQRWRRSRSGAPATRPVDPSGADGEVQLDIEVAGSVAPAADIAVYFGSEPGQRLPRRGRRRGARQPALAVRSSRSVGAGRKAAGPARTSTR